MKQYVTNRFIFVNTVMRNKNRVLNHLPLAKRKVEIINKLGFCECSSNWQESKKLLKALKQKEIKTVDAIKHFFRRGDRKECHVTAGDK